MTESWRTALSRLSRIAQERQLTESEEALWADAQRKRQKEVQRARDKSAADRKERRLPSW